MKHTLKGILLAVFLFPLSFIVYAQWEPPLNCNNIINQLCNINLSNPISGLKIDSVNGSDFIVYGTVPAAAGYKDVLYANDPNRNCDNLDINTTYCLTNSNQLRFSVYYPDSISGIKITCALPVILLFHGGSFFECPSYRQTRIETVCREFAKRGFIALSCEYRRGVWVDNRKNPEGFFTYVSAQQILGVYRACQDIRGLIRSIIHMQRNPGSFDYFGEEFNIDTSNIFLGGMSAGSIMAMNAAYYQRQGQIDSAYPGASTVMGDIDAPYYVGDTTINFIPKIKGVLSMWGGMAIHKTMGSNPGSFFNGLPYIAPMIAFHGKNDDIFPTGMANIYHSPDAKPSYPVNFNIEQNCLVNGTQYVLDDDLPLLTIDAVGIGPDSIWSIFKSRGIPMEVYFDCEMEHGLDEGGTFQSDFGTGLGTDTQVYAYIAGRSATFFVAVMNGIAPNLGRSRFVECENERKKCNTADDAGCSYSVSDEDIGLVDLCSQ